MIFDENFFALIIPLGIVGIIITFGCTHAYSSSKKWFHLYNKVKNTSKYPAISLLVHDIISRERKEYHTYISKDNNSMHLYLDKELSENEKSKIEQLTFMKYVITKGWSTNLLRVEFEKESLSNRHEQPNSRSEKQ